MIDDVLMIGGFALLTVMTVNCWHRWKERLAEYAPAATQASSSSSSHSSGCPMGSGGQQASELPSRARRYMPFMDGQCALPLPPLSPFLVTVAFRSPLSSYIQTRVQAALHTHIRLVGSSETTLQWVMHALIYPMRRIAMHLSIPDSRMQDLRKL